MNKQASGGAPHPAVGHPLPASGERGNQEKASREPPSYPFSLREKVPEGRMRGPPPHAIANVSTSRRCGS